MSGFITIHREAFDHPLLQDGDRFRAWFWLVSKACWKPTQFDISGRIITLERGQLCVSRQQLADAWKWSASAVERFLTRLQTEQMIGRETGQGRSVITICNYAKYQDQELEPGQATGQATGQRSDSDRTAKEQGNKGTIEEEPNGSSTPISPKPEKLPAKKSAKCTIPADWQPSQLPADEQAMVDLWPPGRLKTEIAEFREYWFEDGEKRPGWDRTWRSRIRNIHDRIMRDNRNGPNRSQYPTRDNRDGFARAIDRDLGFDEPPGPTGRYDAGDGGSDSVIPIASACTLR